MNMLDVMDVKHVSYAAPAIGKEWAVSPQAMGSIFSAGLLGGVLIGAGLVTTANFMVFAISPLLAGIATFMIKPSEIKLKILYHFGLLSLPKLCWRQARMFFKQFSKIIRVFKFQ